MATILVVEDDPDVRELVELLLAGEGHQVTAAPDGHAALALVDEGRIDPDLVLADYNLPNGMDGLEVAAKLRERLRHQVPVIILTGDISTTTMRDIRSQHCVQLNKPVKLKEMMQAIERLLAEPREAIRRPAAGSVPLPLLRTRPPTSSSSSMTMPASATDSAPCSRTPATASRLTPPARRSSTAYHPGRGGCLLIDAYLPGMSGLELLHRLRDGGDRMPAIMITGNSDVPMAVEAMKAGASDFIEKPIGGTELLAGVERRWNSRAMPARRSPGARVPPITSPA